MGVTVDNGTLTDYTVTSDTVTGEQVQVVKIMLGGAGTNGGLVAAGTAMPVSGPLTDTQLRATAVPVSGTVTATGPLTDAQLRATAVPVSGPLTDTQLRATAVPVSGTVTATGPLTDTQLRATAVPVSGPLTDTQLRATAVPVSGPVTDAQLRATAVPVSGTVAVSSITTAIVPGTAATNLGKAEDAAHASGDTGVFVLAVRTDTPATTASATGDYDALHTGAEGGLQVSLIAPSRTGMLNARVAAAASTNATLVKNAAGTLHGILLHNNTAVKKFFKLYNLTVAPTVGTSTPVYTLIIPADGGLVLSNLGFEFTTGISYAITNGIADADTTAVAANDVHGVLLYK
jgi:hypothetical protein